MVGWTALTPPWVKLVHHSSEERAAGRLFLAIAPCGDSASLRVAHEPVGTEVRPVTGAAVARCLLHDVMVHSVGSSYTRRYAACSASKLPSVTAREVTHARRFCSHVSVRDRDATVVVPWDFQHTLEHSSVVPSKAQAAEWLVAGQGCSRL
jgi:hypothetical protein